MTEDGQETSAGEARRGERRTNDRRRNDRRAPVPVWRRPPALVAYGVAGTLLVVLALSALGDDDEPAAPKSGEIVAAPPPPPDTTPSAPPQGAAPEPALTTADFERLVIEGDAARGRRVVAQLYCEAPAPVAVSATDTLEADVAALVDTTGGPRVPAAECKWGAQDDPRREDFLLLVPQAHAAEFASAPVTMDGFVRRRRVIAQVEWIGKSRALALRTVGVFRGLARQ